MLNDKTPSPNFRGSHSKPSELSDRIDRIEQLLTENLMQNPDLSRRGIAPFLKGKLAYLICL